MESLVPKDVPEPFEIAAREALQFAEARFPLNYRVRLKWKGYRVTAGIAYYRTGIIGLSQKVLPNVEAVRETVLHEYAHLLAVFRHGRSAANHGAAWQNAMADLGLPPIVRHSFAVERNVKRQRVTYHCSRCGAPIVRHRRLPKSRKYVHANCGGDLRLGSVETITENGFSA
jgi:SprT protein